MPFLRTPFPLPYPWRPPNAFRALNPDENPFPIPPNGVDPPPIEPIPPAKPNSVYRALAVHFDGNTVLDMAGFVCFEPVEKWSFSGWFKAADWSANKTVYMIDPTVNRTPYLATKGGAIFVMLKSEPYSGALQTGIAQIYWSSDAVHWNLATTPIDGLLNLRAGSGGSSVSNANPLYFNGLWAYTFAWQTDPGNTFNNAPANAIVYSYDGVTWQTVWVPSAAQIAAGVITLPPTNSSGAGPRPLNGYNFSNAGLVQPQNVVTIFIGCVNAPNPPIATQFGDQLTTSVAGAILVDPSQPAGSSFYSSSPLPAGVTAVRFRVDSLSTPTQIFFDYTNTPITQAIVDSGAGFPSATWTNSLTLSSSGGQLIYGLPTQGDSTSKLVFSHGGTSRKQDSAQPPLVPANVLGWTHMIGTISLAAGLALLYINDQFAGVFDAQQGAPHVCNGKTLYVGGDGNANNFVGDMADLYFYPNVSFIDPQTGLIEADTRRMFIDAVGAPVDPAVPIQTVWTKPSVVCIGNSALVIGPDGRHFIGFRANTWGTSGLPLSILSGTLTDATSSPSDIYA